MVSSLGEWVVQIRLGRQLELDLINFQLVSSSLGAHSWTWSYYILCSVLVGPVLLEDFHVVEKLAQFDRERIPERVVHAQVRKLMDIDRHTLC